MTILFILQRMGDKLLAESPCLTKKQKLNFANIVYHLPVVVKASYGRSLASSV